jgi:hypothetical protein
MVYRVNIYLLFVIIIKNIILDIFTNGKYIFKNIKVEFCHFVNIIKNIFKAFFQIK